MEERNNYIGAAGAGRSDIQEIEVTVAGAGDRILAALLNQLFTFLVLLVPFVGLIAFAIKNEGRIGSGEEMFGLLLGTTSFWVGLAGILAYTVIQIYYMSRDGQSLGKKIMRIRVLKTDGRNPGFVGTVLVREIAWSVLVAIIAAIIGLIAGENGENAINLLAFLANLVLLFMVKRDRRTLYDILADTVVVKLPK
ncbi:RDD family protein [Neisseria cinerea]|uniref:RDD family protein n=1 Tax=Neisseria cinerea TaxID=483 RepID=UPI0028D7EF18|nr:RDD family protein [Neisseria cinerea]